MLSARLTLWLDSDLRHNLQCEEAIFLKHCGRDACCIHPPCIFLRSCCSTAVLPDLLKYKRLCFPHQWLRLLSEVTERHLGPSSKLLQGMDRNWLPEDSVCMRSAHTDFRRTCANCFAIVIDCKCASRLRKHGTTSDYDWLSV